MTTPYRRRPAVPREGSTVSGEERWRPPRTVRSLKTRQPLLQRARAKPSHEVLERRDGVPIPRSGKSATPGWPTSGSLLPPLSSSARARGHLVPRPEWRRAEPMRTGRFRSAPSHQCVTSGWSRNPSEILPVRVAGDNLHDGVQRRQRVNAESQRQSCAPCAAQAEVRPRSLGPPVADGGMGSGGFGVEGSLGVGGRRWTSGLGAVDYQLYFGAAACRGWHLCLVRCAQGDGSYAPCPVAIRASGPVRMVRAGGLLLPID